MARLIFFDLDGTIFKTTTIYEDVASFLGPSVAKKDECLKQAYLDGKITYMEWCNDIIAEYQRAGLKKADFYRFISSAEYYAGAKELFSTLKDAGYVTCIISGSFDALAKRAQQELRINHRFASIELFWKKGHLDHWNISPTGFEAKTDFMKIIAREYNTPLKDCIFVGDGHNDVYIAESVGTSIGFNPHPDLARVVTHKVYQSPGKEDLRAILKYIDL